MSSRLETNHHTWQDLYKAAVLETDRAKLSERIARAEWAIIVRAHDLFSQRESALQERQALDAALNALRMLKGYQGETNARGTNAA